MSSILFYQNYFDEMALRIQKSKAGYIEFQILKKGEIIHSVPSPHIFEKAYEIKQKKERQRLSEGLYFVIMCRDVEETKKLLIVNVYRDRIIKIKEKTLEMSKYLKNKKEIEVNE